MPTPPFPYRFIAVEGNIGAGKTTLCRQIARDFGSRLVLEQFTDNPFLPPFYQNPERYAFPVELFFMTERHKQLQEELSHPSLFENGMIADYFFMKTLLFARNNLQDDEFRLFQRLFETLNSSFRKPDLLLYLHRPIPVLQSYIVKRGREMEGTISPEYLGQLQETYFEYFKTAVDLPIVVMELGAIDFENNKDNYRFIVDCLNRKYASGVTYVSMIKKIGDG